MTTAEHSLSEPGSARHTAHRVEFTPAARSAIAAAIEADGPQVVLLSWPAGATYLPSHCYIPDEFDVVLGHIDGCPVYSDARRLSLFTNRHVVLDADDCSTYHPRPPLRARVFTAWEPGGRLPTAVKARTSQPGLVQRLVRELAPSFAAVYSESLITSYVRRAVNDLRGSVTAESLPEMAMRLAHHRLSSNTGPQAAH